MVLTIKKWAVVLILILASTCWGIPVLNHDTLDGFEPEEHIDWTVDNVTYDINNSNIDWATSAALIDHSLLLGLSDDDHTQYHNDSRAATWLDLASTTKTALWDTAYAHSLLVAGNPHSVTPAELSLVVGTDVQAWDAQLDSLSALTATEVGYLDGTVVGTIVASKAVVVDASKDIGTFGTVAGSVFTSISTTAGPSYIIDNDATRYLGHGPTMDIILGIDNAGTPDLDDIFIGGVDPGGADTHYNVNRIFIYGKTIRLGDSVSNDSTINVYSNLTATGTVQALQLTSTAHADVGGLLTVHTLHSGGEINFMGTDAGGNLQPRGTATYKANSGNAGLTQSENGVTDFDIVIEDGLITSFTKNN